MCDCICAKCGHCAIIISLTTHPAIRTAPPSLCSATTNAHTTTLTFICRRTSYTSESASCTRAREHSIRYYVVTHLSGFFSSVYVFVCECVCVFGPAHSPHRCEHFLCVCRSCFVRPSSQLELKPGHARACGCGVK